MKYLLHISDLHLVNNSANWENMKNAILNNVHQVLEGVPEGDKLLVLGGDYRFFNGSFDLAKEFLPELFEAMGIKDPAKDVFLVPGNHDIKAVDDVRRDDALSFVRDDTKGGTIETRLGLRMQYLLPDYKEFCQFAKELGIYTDASGFLPAENHVRTWRNSLHILHLNTTLVASSGPTKKNQMVETSSANNQAIRTALQKDGLPSIVLGHNSFFDLNQSVQDNLCGMFSQVGVSAYLCGDRHRLDTNSYQKTINLTNNFSSLTIPNIVCPRSSTNESDEYSDFGMIWHLWDEKSGKVDLKFYTWETNNQGKLEFCRSESYYIQNKKPYTDKIADTILNKWNDCSNRDPEKGLELTENLINYMDSLGSNLSRIMAHIQKRAFQEGREDVWPEYRCASSPHQKPLFYAEILLKNIQYTIQSGIPVSTCFLGKRLNQAMDTIKVFHTKYQNNQVALNKILSLESEAKEQSKKIEAPVVHLDSDFAFLPDPVFSGAFDSVVGKDSSAKDHMEQALFRYIGNGKTVVLQGPQITDNRNMLALLHTDGFRQVCENGFVVFSPYGSVQTPMDYLLSRLKDPGFQFSSTNLYGLKNRKGDFNYRDIIYKALTSKNRFHSFKEQIPTDSLEELEMLFDGYQIMEEVFSTHHSQYYHQDKNQRKGNIVITNTYKKLSELGLHTFIETFLTDLERDEESHPYPGREEFIRFMRDKLQKLSCTTWERSDYYTYIDGQIEQARTSDEHLLRMFELFRKTVDRCYSLYNGKLSCDDVRVLVSDDMLRLFRESDEPQCDFLVDYHITLYQVERADSPLPMMGWKTFLKDAKQARLLSHDLATKKIDKDQYIRNKKEDGFIVRPMYHTDTPYQEFEVVSFRGMTSADNQFMLCPEEGPNAILMPEEHAIIDETIPSNFGNQLQ